MDAPALPSCMAVFPWQLSEGLMWGQGELSSPELTPEEQLDFLQRRPLSGFPAGGRNAPLNCQLRHRWRRDARECKVHTLKLHPSWKWSGWAAVPGAKGPAVAIWRREKKKHCRNNYSFSCGQWLSGLRLLLPLGPHLTPTSGQSTDVEVSTGCSTKSRPRGLDRVHRVPMRACEEDQKRIPALKVMPGSGWNLHPMLNHQHLSSPLLFL